MPILVDLPTPLMDLPFPQRLIDVIGNRMSIDSYTFEYYQQTARVNEAAPVADLALKPTSTFTVEAVSGRAQIIATLSQPCPVRIYLSIGNPQAANAEPRTAALLDRESGVDRQRDAGDVAARLAAEVHHRLADVACFDGGHRQQVFERHAVLGLIAQ